MSALVGYALAAAPQAAAVDSTRLRTDLCSPSLLERSLGSGEAHVYGLDLDESLLVRVEQRQLDVVLELESTDGQRRVYDQPTYHWGEEVIILDVGAGAQTPNQLLRIRPASEGAAAGSYVTRCLSLTDLGGTERDAWTSMARAGQLWPLQTAESSHQALGAYVEALRSWRALADVRRQAETLHAMALLRLQTGDIETAAASLRRALKLWTDVGEMWRVAAVHHGLGYTHGQLGQLDAARDAYATALELWQQLGWTHDAARTRNNLCLVDHVEGKLTASIDCYSALRRSFQELGDRWYEALVLNNLGGVYDLQDLPDQALEHYQEALEIWRQFEASREIAQTLNNMAVVHRRLGEFQRALRTYERALEAMPATETRLRGSILHNVGGVYVVLGEPRRARAFLEQALELRRQTAHRSGEVSTLSLLGRCLQTLGEDDLALAAHRQAMTVAEELQHPALQAQSLRDLGGTLHQQGKTDLALPQLRRALELYRQLGQRQGESMTLQRLGLALADARQREEAVRTLEASVTLQRQLDDRLLLLTGLSDLAGLELERTVPDSEWTAHARRIRQYLEEALELAETLRLEIVHPRLRATFLASRAQIFEQAIDLHVALHERDPQAGHHLEALRISERSRSRSLLDLLTSAETRTADRSVPASTARSEADLGHLQQRRSQLLRELRAVADRQQREIEDTEARKRHEHRMQQRLAELDLLESRVRGRDATREGLAQTPILSTASIQALLDAETVLIEYALGERRSFAWRITASRIDVFELPARSRVERLARQTWTGFKTVLAGGTEVVETQQLADAILAPILLDLPSQVRRLAIVPDGALHYLPFAALPHANGKVLIEDFEVVYLASASALALLKERAAALPVSPRTAIFADPVFSADDPRCADVPPEAATAAGSTQRAGIDSDPEQAWPRLSASRREAQAVADLRPEQTRLVLDFDAHRDALLHGGLSDFGILHFATHGHIDARHPELSGLILSQVDARCRPRDGFLGLADLSQLRLNAELIVLSGCGTALGEEIQGEGLVGMTQAFLHAGTPRVVASLWQVQDRATAELMEHFYRALWQQGVAPAAALRSAQLLLRADPRRRHPYFWAAFVLQGDWH